MTTIKKNTITIEEYLEIRACIGWIRLQEKQAETALKNSLLTVGIYDQGNLVGMGRLVGDGAVICYVQDLIVVPEYQHMGIGSEILHALIEHVEGLRMDGTQMMLCLMCAKGREPFYEKHGFVARPTDALGPGMIQYMKDC